MNEIRRIESEIDEISRVRVIMDRFPLPSFVTGYGVELGYFQDEPSLWIHFQTSLHLPESQDETLAAGEQLVKLVNGAHIHLREHYPERYPYFRFPESISKDSKLG